MIEKSVTTSLEAKSIVDSTGKPRPMTLNDIQEFLNLAGLEEWPHSSVPEIVTDESGTYLTFIQLRRKTAK